MPDAATTRTWVAEARVDLADGLDRLPPEAWPVVALGEALVRGSDVLRP